MKTNSFCLNSSGFFLHMSIDSKTARWNNDQALPIIRNMSPLWFFAQSGFSSKCCPIAESQVLVVILDLQD